MTCIERQAQIIDICQRVFGTAAQVSVQYAHSVYWVEVFCRRVDPITRSEQEMDAIIGLQHALAGAAVRLQVNEE